ncbi:hypothetical protein BDW74DRAFT_149131 [Aspergillus multicolor]|uniref:uncharacterized protein n=1 Tax=Aspergillus multicolor TaxID=41759 RepID=UPI003CCD0B8C
MRLRDANAQVLGGIKEEVTWRRWSTSLVVHQTDCSLRIMEESRSASNATREARHVPLVKLKFPISGGGQDS